MSRCYPYPPPGYDKKANVELALSVKKERRKHKDKKKRRKDNETNGDLPRGLDKRSKKSHQVGVIISEDRILANGSLFATKVSQSDHLHEKASQRLPAGSTNAEMLSDGMQTSNGKGHDVLGEGGHEVSLVAYKVPHDSNGALTCKAVPCSGSKVKLNEDEPIQYVPHVEMDWSPIDDQEWLFHHMDSQARAEPSHKMDESNPPLVLAEAVLLPTAGIYALPYVIPD